MFQFVYWDKMLIFVQNVCEMNYLLKVDITDRVKEQKVDEWTETKDSVLDALESSAIEIAKGYTRHWYDVEKEFRKVNLYDVLTAYTVDQRIYDEANAKHYICIQDAIAGTLLSDTDYFAQQDDRNAVLLEIVIDVLIYNLSSRQNSRQMNQLRIDRYDSAIDKLKDAQKGRIMLDIAQRVDVETDDSGHEFVFGQIDGMGSNDY